MHATRDFSHGESEPGMIEPKQTTFASILNSSKPSEEVAKVEAALIAEGDMHLGGLRQSESFKSVTSAELDDFAWSPRSSEDGQGVPDPLTQAQDSVGVKSHTLNDGSHTNLGVSTSGENTSSSPESYGNTQNLLQLSSSGVSNIFPASDPSHAPSTSIGSSKFAGDLLLPTTSWGVANRQRSVHSISRLSGIVTDGKTSRPMSEAELSDSLSSIMLGGLPKGSSISNTSIQSKSKAAVVDKLWLPRRAATMKLSQHLSESNQSIGLGSSRAGSSEIHAHPTPQNPGREGRQELHRGTSSSKLRESTPPGLFGRRAAALAEEPSSLRPTLFRQNSRLAQAAAAAGIKQDGRLGRAMAGSPEREWATETDAIRSEKPTRLLQLDSMTGSSLADNSDSGDLSSADQSQQNVIQVEKRMFVQYPSHPRYNQSWSLIKNLGTGDTNILPDYVSGEGSRLPNVRASPETRSFTNPGPSPHYRHPKPLPKDHQHPLSSSPVMTPFGIELQQIGHTDGLTTQQKRAEMARTESEYSCATDDDWRIPSQRGSVLRAHDAADSELEASLRLPTLRHHLSETWLSTVSEAQSADLSPQPRISSFAKITMFGRKGNVTGTPEGRGAREVGSSLADNSSPAANFSSSPPVFSNSPPVNQLSPITDIATPPPKPESAVKAFHSHLAKRSGLPVGVGGYEEQNSPHGQDLFGYMISPKVKQMTSLWATSPSSDAHGRKLKKRSHRDQEEFGPRSAEPRSSNVTLSTHYVAQGQSLLGPSLTGIIHPPDEREEVNWLKYLPAIGSKNNSRRRSSSSESEGRLRAAPTAQKTSALKHPKHSTQHKFRNAEDSLATQADETQDLEKGGTRGVEKEARHNMRSASSLPNHLEYDETEYNNTPTPGFDSSSPRFNRSAQSMLRSVSPRLHSIPCAPDVAKLKKQKRCSRLWALVCLLVPFLGPLYGHGYLDGIMSWHSNGEIQKFCTWEKTAVLTYSYTFLVAVLVTLVLIMIL